LTGREEERGMADECEDDLHPCAVVCTYAGALVFSKAAKRQYPLCRKNGEKRSIKKERLTP